MKPKFDAAELVTSPMKHVTMLLPEVLLDKIDAAAERDDPSCPNRSSFIRRSIIAALRREAA
jgi:metal-responsive CopG/Arc/MetJ family transcriptional regulator